MAKKNIPLGEGSSLDYSHEMIKLNELTIKADRTTSGPCEFTSSTSGITYNINDYSEANIKDKGELGMINLLRKRYGGTDGFLLMAEDINGLVKSVSYNKGDGVITLTKYDGTPVKIDTLLEKMPVSFSVDDVTNDLVITLDDGNSQRVSLSKFVDVYTFKDGTTIDFTENNHNIIAEVKEGSLEDKHFKSGLIGELSGYATSAAKSASDASGYANKALEYRNAAEGFASSASNSSSDASNYASVAEQAKSSAEDFSKSAENWAIDASSSMVEAEKQAQVAATNSGFAEQHYLLAKSYAVGNSGVRDGENTDNAEHYKEEAQKAATNAAASESTVSKSAEQAAKSATTSQSWAIGGTKTRTDEDTNNAKYFAGQAKSEATAAGKSAGQAVNSAAQAANHADLASGYAQDAAFNSEGSWKHAEDAKKYAAEAAASAEDVDIYWKLSKSYAVGKSGIGKNDFVDRSFEDSDNSKYYKEKAQEAASNAATREWNASQSAAVAGNKATEAQSWAIGGTGTRAGEDTNNAKYYSDQAIGVKEAVQAKVDEAQRQASRAEDAAELAVSWTQGGTGREDRGDEDENNAMYFAIKAKRYAVGGTGTAEYEDTDNARYYSQRAGLWAVGDESSTTIPSNINSAKYFAEQAEVSRIETLGHASAAAESASKAAEAESYAVEAEENAKTARVWAVGWDYDGNAPGDKNNSRYWASVAKANASATQGNWAQGDENKPDYIYNRTHYTDVISDGGIIMEEKSLTFGTIANAVMISSGLGTDHIRVGGKYKVIWNGFPYTCVAYLYNDDVTIGNASLIGGGGENTREPFCLTDMDGTSCTCYKESATAETITVAVEGVRVEVVKQLDPKYIKDMYYTENAEELLTPTAATHINGNQFKLTNRLGLVAGEEYSVTINDVEYVATAKKHSDGFASGVALGNTALSGVSGAEDTGEAYLIIDLNEGSADFFGYGVMAYFGDGSVGVTVSVSTMGAIHKIPAKYIPGGAGGGGDLLNENGVIKKEYFPDGFPYDAVSLTEVELVPETELIYSEEHGFVTNETVIEPIPGSTYTVTYNGVEYICEATAVSQEGITIVCLGNLVELGIGISGGDEPFIMMFVPQSLIPSIGYNLLVYPIGDTIPESITVKVVGLSSDVTKMAFKYMPEGYPSKYVADMEIIPECSPSVDNTLDSLVLKGRFAIPIIGEAYTVYVDGVETQTYAKPMPAELAAYFDPTGKGCILGNLKNLGGVDTGEDFLFVFGGLELYQESGYHVIPFGVSGSLIRVVGPAYQYSTIDPFYLPKWLVQPTVIESGSGIMSVKTPGASDASGERSFAEGRGTNAFALASHAEGDYTKASGSASHSEGISTTASGYASHAEGYYSESLGHSSHAEGYATRSSSEGSHAEGYYTRASSNYQHVQGKFNTADTEGKYAHIVGNGSGDFNRSNAHTVDWDGNAWFAGSVEGDSIIIRSSTEGSDKKFTLTVDDNGNLSGVAGTGGTGEDGASAYEIALEHGFEGSEEEWLASLKGEDGADGNSFVISDVYATLSDLQAAFPVGNEYAYQVTGENNEIFIWSENSSSWKSLGALQGPKGDKGASGDPGAAATIVGVSASVDSGVGTPSVTVSNIGDSSAANFKFEFKNLKGATGETGSAGKDGAPGKDGVSATHSWSGTTLTITSASGSSSANLKGDKGETGSAGKDGSDGVSTTHSWNGTTLTVTSASGTSSANLKGEKGNTGDPGADGKDGISCTHSWNGTTLTVTSASGTSSMDLKGEKGDSITVDSALSNSSTNPVQNKAVYTALNNVYTKSETESLIETAIGSAIANSY